MKEKYLVTTFDNKGKVRDQYICNSKFEAYSLGIETYNRIFENFAEYERKAGDKMTLFIQIKIVSEVEKA